MDILKKAPWLLAIFRRDGDALWATDQMESEIPELNDNLYTFTKYVDFDQPTETIINAIRNGERITFFGKKSGHRVWRFVLEANQDGETLNLFAEDVANRYRDMLRDRILVELVERTPDYVGIAREDRSGLWVNQSMSEAIGVRSREELNQTTIADVHPEGIGPYSIERALEIARHHGHVLTETSLHHRQTDQKVDVSMVLTAHHDPLSGQYFFSAIERDITSERNTEEQLRSTQKELEILLAQKSSALAEREQEVSYSHEVWRSLFEYSQDLVLFTDQSGQILFNNQGFLPDDNRDLSGTSAFDLLVPTDRETVRHEYHELMAGRRKHISLDSECVCALRIHKYCVVLINRLERSSGGHAATWVISDATEARETRELLLANEKMAATGRMAARIAHEINNPLAAMRSSLELVRMNVAEGRPVEEYVELMNSELDRVSNIIRQMYGLYRPEQDTLRPTELTGLVMDCVTLLESSAQQQQVLLLYECPDPVWAMASEAGLRQVLFNLIQNALDSSPAGATVLVRTDESGDRARIRVEDEGAGLDPEHADRLFEPFFTTKDSYSGNGLGLGLSVSVGLVKAMGGDLDLANREAGGARATIRLRRANESAN